MGKFLRDVKESLGVKVGSSNADLGDGATILPIRGHKLRESLAHCVAISVVDECLHDFQRS